MNNTIEHYRVFSKLSGLCYFKEFDNKKYMIVAGICLPCHVGICLVLYVMTGSGAYKESLGQQLDLSILEKLNPGDTMIENLKTCLPWKIVDSLYERMGFIMREWTSGDFEQIVCEHGNAFYDEPFVEE